MKKIIVFVSLLIFTASCTSSTVDIGADKKKDFVIDTISFASLSHTGTIQKVGKISSSQQIDLSSQALGRVGAIAVKEGDKVAQGQILASLQDTIGSYSINLERAKNMLEKTQINYDSTKISLEKQVFDSQIALEKLENSLKTLKSNTAIDIGQAKNDIENADYTGLDSKTALDLEKLDNSIAKAELDYENVLSSNTQTIDGYIQTYQKEHINLLKLATDVNDFADKLFDFSGNYTDQVKYFKDFLGGQDVAGREATKQDLAALREFTKDVLVKIDVDEVTEETLPSSLEAIEDAYSQIDTALDGLQKVFASSIISVGQLSQTNLDTYTATTNSYQATYAANTAGFIVFKNATTSFLKTYKSSQTSLAKQLEILKQDKAIFLKSLDIAESKTTAGYDKLVVNSDDSIRSTELQIKLAVENLDNAKKMKELTLRSLDNAIADAQIGYEQSIKEYSKLTITSPIAGVVGEVKVDKGQDVATGTPMLTLLGDKKSEVEISFKAEELPLISVGTKVTFDYNGVPTIGTIYSVTKSTDNNFNYKANVIFDTQLDILGGVANVAIPLKVKYPLLPLSSVKIIGTNKGIISLYIEGKIVEREIVLGNIYEDTVEFVSNADGSTLNSTDTIIISDVENYDETKFQIKTGI